MSHNNTDRRPIHTSLTPGKNMQLREMKRRQRQLVTGHCKLGMVPRRAPVQRQRDRP